MTKIKSFVMRLILVLVILQSFAVILAARTHAYWSDIIFSQTKTAQIIITIGEWLSPDGPIVLDGWNLNIWEEEDTLNQNVPEEQMFTYDGNIYISINGGYNPFYHGMPGEPNTQWAFVATGLDWKPNMNYRVHSVVIRDGRYFIANILYNSTDWFVNDPLTNNGLWKEWREIEPISQEHFGLLQDTNLIDYASPDWDYIIYK